MTDNTTQTTQTGTDQEDRDLLTRTPDKGTKGTKMDRPTQTDPKGTDETKGTNTPTPTIPTFTDDPDTYTRKGTKGGNGTNGKKTTTEGIFRFLPKRKNQNSGTRGILSTYRTDHLNSEDNDPDRKIWTSWDNTLITLKMDNSDFQDWKGTNPDNLHLPEGQEDWDNLPNQDEGTWITLYRDMRDGQGHYTLIGITDPKGGFHPFFRSGDSSTLFMKNLLLRTHGGNLN